MADDSDWMSLKSYHSERKLLIDAEREAARSYDKTMITLSAGALAFSIGFIKDIAPSPVQRCLLLAAWCLFAVSLFTIMLSFLLSQVSMRRQREILDDDQLKICKARDAHNCWQGRVQSLNLASMISFMLGVGFLALFVVLNLN